ncbi:DNA methyltransferase [Streptomyces sp. NPDC005548]|uniref:DNA methyltransferase n=1 Tax=Streptomyces sp. NPDC005548 TaxID=3364724 RepID=UPI0036C71AFD
MTETQDTGVTYLRTADIPLDELTPFPGNAKRGDVDAIRASLRRNGQYRGLVVREIPDGPLIVLAGNHTLQALTAEGAQTARCDIVLCDDPTARRINLVDNKAAELGTYDNDALAELLSYMDGDLEGTGYTQDDVDALLDYPEDPETLTDPDDVPDPPDDSVSKPGDIWHLGPHRVLCGDSTDITAVEAMLNGDRADCMWTDPPYGVDYVGKTKDALTIQNDGAADLPELLAGAFATATAALKPGAPVYIAHAPGPLSLDFAQAFLNAGWLLRQNLIWVKDAMVLGRSDYHYRHEPIMYGFTDPDPGSGRLGRGGDRWFGDNAQTSVLEVPKPPRSEDHPTMKPVELVTRCLTNSCRPGGMVYEPFGGSGTTLIAAHATRRIARLVELDPRYVDVICRRYQQHTGTQPVLESTGEAHDFTAPADGDTQ